MNQTTAQLVSMCLAGTLVLASCEWGPPELPPRVDASSTSDTDDTRNADSRSVAADADVQSNDTAEPYRHPDPFYGCLEETVLHPAERIWRGTAPETDTSRAIWSSKVPLEGSAVLDNPWVGTISAPSLTAVGTTVEQPAVVFTSIGGGYTRKEHRWVALTLTGNEVGGGEVALQAEDKRHLGPPTTVRSLRASGFVTPAYGEHDSGAEYYRFSVEWSARGQKDYALLDAPPVDSVEVGRHILMPDGMSFMRWGDDSVVAIESEVFDSVSNIAPRRAVTWRLNTDLLWRDSGPDATVVRVTGARPKEGLALVEHSDGTRRWVGFDRCGARREIVTAEHLGDEILWNPVQHQYLVLVDDESVVGGGRPTLVEDGQVYNQADFGCRNILQSGHRQWACLQEFEEGFRLLRFGRHFSVQEAIDLEVPGPYSWRTAHLNLAGEGGALVVTGIVEHEEGGSEFGVGVIGDEHDFTMVRAVDEDTPDPGELARRIGVLGPHGAFVFTSKDGVYAVQTPLAGLAATHHPRALYGGNEGRGYVDP